jgi:glycerate 2-kinase
MSRAHAEAILRAAIDAAAPAPLVRRALDGALELQDDAPIHLLAIGKAAPQMVEPAFELYGDRIARHLIVAPEGTASARPARFGNHPLPGTASLQAGEAVRALLEDVAAGEHLLVLLSGGASASVALPLGAISIDEYADCVRGLMRAGAAIFELNMVRKHIDGLKGGRMAALARPARTLGLVMSDVVGDDLSTIASGPLSPDPTTARDALRVLHQHALLDACAPSIRALLEDTAETGAHESPKPGDDVFTNVRVRIVAGNDVAINGAADTAASLGYHVRRATEPVTGLAREAGASLGTEALELQRLGPLPACIVAGGETTVAVTGSGRGGRNQEIVLAACVALDGVAGITVGSVGTDGVDGPTDAAGAIADAKTLERAAARGPDARRALDDNDSYTFFSEAGYLITTGPTGTNLNDVQVALVTDLPAAPVRPPR